MARRFLEAELFTMVPDQDARTVIPEQAYIKINPWILELERDDDVFLIVRSGNLTDQILSSFQFYIQARAPFAMFNPTEDSVNPSEALPENRMDGELNRPIPLGQIGNSFRGTSADYTLYIWIAFESDPDHLHLFREDPRLRIIQG